MAGLLVIPPLAGGNGSSEEWLAGVQKQALARERRQCLTSPAISQMVRIDFLL